MTKITEKDKDAKQYDLDELDDDEIALREDADDVDDSFDSSDDDDEEKEEESESSSKSPDPLIARQQRLDRYYGKFRAHLDPSLAIGTRGGNDKIDMVKR